MSRNIVKYSGLGVIISLCLILSFSILTYFQPKLISVVQELKPVLAPELKTHIEPSKKVAKWEGIELLDYNDNPKVPILMYHSIATYESIDPKDPKPELARGLRIPPELLKKQLDFLKAKGYTTITFADLEAYSNQKTKIPKNSIILSFDDGFADNFIAYELLKTNNQIGVFAIITGLIDQGGRLSNSQLEQMHQDGMELVSHTVNHRSLATLNNTQIISELKDSQIRLSQITKKPITTLIYPAGSYNTLVITEAKKLGYTLAATTKYYNPNLGLPLNSPLELTRVRVECSVPASSNYRSNLCPGFGSWIFKGLQ
jgi:peptidoglycan/xylan/chitin deacetylase (PgdA/CDA1 family)